ncbi:hypothetical protein L6R50_03125 [Myxococcota bacterium]|nr:hypothetical protein [Myxococcota bacterium]
MTAATCSSACGYAIRLQRRIYDLSWPPLLAVVGRKTVGRVAILRVALSRSPEIPSDSHGRARPLWELVPVLDGGSRPPADVIEARARR